jgi:hypothetical protein
MTGAPVPYTRRLYELKDVALLVGLMANVAGLVWGAATLAAEVRHLGTQLVRLETAVGEWAGLDARVRVLEDRGRR